MAGARGHGGFKLDTEGYASWSGSDTIFPCHLSPKTSASSMTVCWFKDSECIYLYKNGQVIEGRGYEGRLTLDIQKLQRGNVSLTLRGRRETDKGVYICQVQHGEQVEEIAVGLASDRNFSNHLAALAAAAYSYAARYLRVETAEQKDRRQRSVHVLEQKIREPEVERVTSGLHRSMLAQSSRQETPPVTRQDFEELKTKLEKFTVQVETKLEKLTVRVDEGEKTIQTLQGSRQVVLHDIEQLTRELEKSKKKWSVTSNQVKQITDQLRDKERELEKINHQLEGEQKLKSVRLKFVNKVSEVNLDSLLDQLLDKGVINDHEMESVKDVRPRADKARAIIDMVRMKGDGPSSKMMEILEKDQNFTYGAL